jgi:hypothetical protein
METKLKEKTVVNGSTLLINEWKNDLIKYRPINKATRCKLTMLAIQKTNVEISNYFDRMLLGNRQVFKRLPPSAVWKALPDPMTWRWSQDLPALW